MAKIAGTYNITIALSNAQYTFTGNDRAAQFTPSSPDVLNPAYCSQLNAQQAVAGLYETEIRIKRARVISSGAPGLQAPEGLRACQLLLSLAKQDGTNEFDSIFLKINNWNEWTDINGTLSPSKGAEPALWDDVCKPVFFFIKYLNTYFNVDDYNLQSAYIGQTFKPILELEIDTAGMVDTYAYKVF